MAIKKELLTPTKHAKYLEVLQFYVELVTNSELMEKQGYEKHERVAIVLKEVRNLIDFLQTHKLSFFFITHFFPKISKFH